ncbi:MAG: hypothetical protein ACOY7P_17760, partial [Pseudomonadota bacterium]
MNDFSIFEYLYRDAGNYKTWCSVLLAGRAAPIDTEIVKASLDRGEFFIAEQIGLPAAYRKADGAMHVPTEDDHVWHEFSELRPAEGDDI